eukprot:19327-Heterococcus_DN1.PRE.2
MAIAFPVEYLVAIAVAVFTFIALIVHSTKGDRRSQLVGAKKACRELIDKSNCGPILVRLAWHDSGTYDNSKKGQPFKSTGGANGSIRFEPEIKHGANAGLSKGLTLLEPIKAQYPKVSWADLIQLASAVAVEHAGGPRIAMKYGRVDASGPDECPKDIVTLSGAHTLGRAFKERSGTTPHVSQAAKHRAAACAAT